MFELRFGPSQVSSYKDLLQWSRDIMVPATRCASRLHWVLYTHWYVVSKYTEKHIITLFFIPFLTFCPHLKSFGQLWVLLGPITHLIFYCMSSLCSPFLSLCPGVWAASFMKWSLADLSSPDRQWRTSFTSYSASSVRRHQWNSDEHLLV